MVDRALSLWGVSGAQSHLAANRENAVYDVQYGKRRFALRLHRVGYRTSAELNSELQWMAVAAQGGLSVPSPVAALDGALLREVDGIQVDVLTWLEGAPMSQDVDTLPADGRAALFHALGYQMAQLHDVSDAWTRPAGFIRCSWDADGLVGPDPLWGRFWENPHVSHDDQVLFVRMRNVARQDLAQLAGSLDFGLIHADLVPTNVMVDHLKISLIDFDDGGFGFRLFELATALLKFRNDPDFDALRSALLKGYRSVRSIDTTALPLFLALRALTYVGWNITRMHEAGGFERNSRFVSTAREMCHAYLDTRSR